MTPAWFVSLTVLWGAAFAGLSNVAAQEPESPAVAREFGLRSAALESIQQGRALSVDAARDALLELPAPEWVLDLEARLAAERFDVRMGFTEIQGGETPGALATRIALVADGDGGHLVAALRAGLESPFSAARGAAIGRLARASAVDPARAKQLLALAAGAAQGPDLDRIADLCAAIGLDACLDFSAIQSAGREQPEQEPEQEKEEADEGAEALTAVLSRFEQLVALPVSERALGRLRELVGEAEGGLAVVELLRMVRSVRRGEPVSVQAASIQRYALAAQGDPMGVALEAASEEGRRAWVFRAPEGATSELGRRLIAAAMVLDPKGATPSPALRAGLRLVAPSEAFQLAHKLPGKAASEALAIADETSRPVAARALAPLLEDPAHPLFEGAVWIVGRRLVHGGEGALEPLIVGLLTAEDDDMRLRAFGWLATAGKESEGPLRVAFDRAGESDGDSVLTELQQLYLRELDRDRPHPRFQDVILRELDRPGAVDVSAIDLAAALRLRPAVRDALVKRLDVAVQAAVSAPTLAGRLPHDGLASQLVRALGREGLDAAEAALLATRRLLYHNEGGEAARPKLPKAAIAVLAASDPFRVERFLDPSEPRRVRMEAALQIAHRSEDEGLLGRAATSLMEDFDGVDGSLQLAAIRALCELPASVGPARLSDFAQSTMLRRGTAVGLAAVDLMAARGRAGLLAAPVLEVVGGPGALVADEAAFETALAAARRLPALPLGSRIACGLVRDLDRRLFLEAEWGDRAQERGALADLRGELLVGLAGELASGRLPEGLDSSVLPWLFRAPMAFAAPDLEARLAGEQLLKPEFRWNAEVRCLRLLGARGMAEDALEATPGWWRMDGRLLAALGAVAGDGDAAGWLYRMSLFAMEGERGADDTALRLASARLGYIALLRGGQWPRLVALKEIARIEADLAADLRSGALRAGVLGAAYGRAAGIPSMGVPAGDPGEAPLVTARAGLRTAAAQHEYLQAVGARGDADSRLLRLAEGAAATWERWRRLRVAGAR